MTRPLMAALHRMPPHAVLVLHVTCAHLPRPDDPDGESREELTESFLHAVDRVLGDYRAEHPSPLVLVGAPQVLERFRTTSRHVERLAGCLDIGAQATALDLALASAAAVEDYLRTRRDDALVQLESAVRSRPGDVASGVGECWRAVGSRRPAMLLVEESFTSPGPVPGTSPRPQGRATAAGPSELHDLVDDLMEQVILRQDGRVPARGDDRVAHPRGAAERGRPRRTPRCRPAATSGEPRHPTRRWHT